ncbi:MAG: hypothetical protein IKW76_04460 [Clostridia bacterium]|nr:hypothetical protein [Clostridia bacterium]
MYKTAFAKRGLSVLVSLLLALGCCVIAAAAEDAPHYVVLGDSIAFGSGLSNPRQAVYGRIVADTNGYAYDNFAVPGHTTQNLLQRMQNEQVKTAIADADIISISIGGNNFLLGNLNALLYDAIVKEDYTRFDEIADRFYDDLQQIIETIRQLNPDAAILLQTIYNPQTGYVGEVYQQGANRFNDLFRQYAAEHPEGILLVDVAQVLTDSDRDFAEDRIHPSAVGNEKIARAVLQTLFDNGLGTQTTPVIAEAGRDMHGTGAFTWFVQFYGGLFHLLSVVRHFFISVFAR